MSLPLSEVRRKAAAALKSIRASLSRVWTRFLGWLMFKVFRRLMTKLLVSPKQMAMLKEADEVRDAPRE